MDPLLEATLAGDVLRFVQYCVQLLTNSGELYRQVELEAEDIIRTSIRQVRTLAQGAIEHCHVYQTKLDRGFLDVLVRSELQRLCRECHEISLLLEQRLSALELPKNTPRRGWTSLVVALIGVWSKRDLEAVIKRLGDAKATLESGVLVDICSEVTLDQVQQHPRFEALSIKNQQLISALLNVENTVIDGLESNVSAVCVLLSRMELVVPEKGQPNRLVGDIFKRMTGECPTTKVILTKSGLAAQNHVLDEQVAIGDARADESKMREAVNREILNSLALSNVARQVVEDVSEDEEQSFSWIFRDPEQCHRTLSGRPWSNFKDWLKEGGGLYWVSGKEASGKSTLMRTITTNPRTRKHLRRWHSSHKNAAELITAEFFYSANGTPEQRSQSGLFRSILYEFLREEPRLIPIIFPKEWSTAYCNATGFTALVRQEFGDAQTSYLSATGKFNWTKTSLKNAVKSLFSQTTVPIRGCLFIDGLDEYEGEARDLAELFGAVAQSRTIKCCISSCRTPVFEPAFGRYPSLQLELLTRPEMSTYVYNQFKSSPRILRLMRADPEQFMDLIDEMVTSADGAYLWLNLAVSSVIRQFQSSDGLTEIYKNLHRIPRNLEKLYQYIIVTNKYKREEAVRMFYLVATASTNKPDDWKIVSPMTLLGLSFAAENDDSMALEAPLAFTPRKESVKRCVKMVEKLKINCGGLLRIQKLQKIDGSGKEYDPRATVTFVHRTVKEFLTKPNTMKWMLHQTRQTNFNASLAILRSSILLLKAEETVSAADRNCAQFIDEGILYARRAEAELGDMDYVLHDTIHEFARTIEHWYTLNILSQPILNPHTSDYSLAVQCGLSGYLRWLLEQDNIITEAPLDPGSRSLISLALHLPSGYERFASPHIVNTLLEFGADPNEAGGLLASYLGRGYAEEDALSSWADILKLLIPKQKRIYQGDVEALSKIYQNRPEEWHALEPVLLRAGMSRAQSISLPLKDMMPKRRYFGSI